MACPWKDNPLVAGGVLPEKTGFPFGALDSIDDLSIAGFTDIVKPAFVIDPI
jgi:hypothetical protein